MPITISEDLHARLDKLEQQLGQMRVSNKTIVWGDRDRPPVVNFLIGFQMLDITRVIGIRCPRAHLRLYDLFMRSLGRDDGQLLALFPLSLSGPTQQWFALLYPSRWRTWDELAHEFLRQYSFSTTIDVSRREPDSLRQRLDETVISAQKVLF